MANKYRSLGFEISVGKKSLTNIIDYRDGRYDYRIELLDSDGDIRGCVEISQKGMEFLESGGKFRTLSVAEYKKSIK